MRGGVVGVEWWCGGGWAVVVWYGGIKEWCDGENGSVGRKLSRNVQTSICGYVNARLT